MHFSEDPVQPKRREKKKKTMTELKEEIDNCTDIIGGFNTLSN